jgi:hypothetical protein
MIIRLVILILLCESACAQEIPSVSLRIKEDTLTCLKACDTVTASLTFTNDSNSDILVYGLKSGQAVPAFNGLSGLCDVMRTGTGMQFALYHTDGTQELAEFGIVDHDIGKGRIPDKKIVDSILRVGKAQFLSSGKILRRHEEVTLITEIPLNQFNLNKGLYYLQIVYYCGAKSAEVLDSNGVIRPANLFQGCAMSSKVPFFVSHARRSKWRTD